jgi:hypothetical protein
MVMKKQLEKWKKYLSEEKKPNQERYEAKFYLNLEQSKDVDRTELMNFMRAIPNVTTVYREEEISTSKESFVGEYRFRFVLPVGTDSKYYYDQVLKTNLKRIKGLSIQRDLGYEKIEKY